MHGANSPVDFFALHKTPGNDYLPFSSKETTNSTSPIRLRIEESETIMNFKKSYSVWRKYRQTVNELSRMSDRELSDLGIARGDIGNIARRAAA